MDVLKKIFEKQYELNKRILKERHDTDYDEICDHSNKSKEMDSIRTEWILKYNRAQIHESIELEDSFPWKWWKDGEEIDWQNEAFIYHSSRKRSGVFTDEFELAYVKDGEPILFDRRNDPDQVHNLFDSPEYGEVVAELTRRIIEHNVDFNSPAVEWLKELT